MRAGGHPGLFLRPVPEPEPRRGSKQNLEDEAMRACVPALDGEHDLPEVLAFLQKGLSPRGLCQGQNV